MRGLDRKISFFLISISFLLLYNIKSLKIWAPSGGPKEGFLPLLCTIVLLVCAVMLIFTSNKTQVKKKEENKKQPDEIKPLIFFSLMFGSILLINHIGYILSFALFLIGTLTIVQRISFLKSLQIYIILMAFVYIIFIWWLDVPLPIGSLWEDLIS